MQQASLQANLIAIEGGVVCLVPWDGGKRQERTVKLTRRIAEELGRAFEEAPVVVAGNRCDGLADYPAAWERCGRMIRIGRSFGLTGALSSQDFGPLPMLYEVNAQERHRHLAVGELRDLGRRLAVGVLDYLESPSGQAQMALADRVHAARAQRVAQSGRGGNTIETGKRMGWTTPYVLEQDKTKATP